MLTVLDASTADDRNPADPPFPDMSKAFTSEETADAPIVVRARAPLPAGVPNYMTGRGLALLRAEHAELESERAAAEAAPEDVRRSRLLALGPRLAELSQRIGSAVVLEPPSPEQPPPEDVRFGATVEVRNQEGESRRYRIVGVDEANAREGRVAFVSPIARALLGRRVGETVPVPTPRGEEELEITAIGYE